MESHSAWTQLPRSLTPSDSKYVESLSASSYGVSDKICQCRVELVNSPSSDTFKGTELRKKWPINGEKAYRKVFP